MSRDLPPLGGRAAPFPPKPRRRGGQSHLFNALEEALLAKEAAVWMSPITDVCKSLLIQQLRVAADHSVQ